MQAILPEVRGKYRFDVDLSNLCWFGVGGKASVVFSPADQDDLIHFLQNKQDIPIFVFGVGSNILIRDGGFNGVVIRLGNCANYIKLISDYMLEVGASVLDQNVAFFAIERKIGGMEFLSGIPGTIGGGLAMNAGAYGREFSHIVRKVHAVDLNGNLLEFTKQDMDFKYRSNGLKEQVIFLAAELQGYRASLEEIEMCMNRIKTQRNATQPVKGVKTGGSTFKNPLYNKAWRLIDEACCRGLQIGGAQVSTLHCNFIINTGNATAADIEELISVLQQRVFESSGITLEREIIFVGEK
jgi:UDP-N-acetylmuramate dehydrogenase